MFHDVFVVWPFSDFSESDPFLCAGTQVAQAARLFKGVFYATVAAYLLDYVVGFGGVLIMIFGTFVIAKSRARIGKVYNIHVDPFENCCLSFWCGCCVVSQVRSNAARKLNTPEYVTF